ncbi:ErfK/YbiS/YcfS/YnhG family protein [Methylobacterium sp. ME121]|nr:ErfK/YbiS/YcfS/YnhG family protein [Methylobacterium sp. ME121]GEM98766.1 hypothetical protein MRA01_33060 [Methylobacterium radiotolerans]
MAAARLKMPVSWGVSRRARASEVPNCARNRPPWQNPIQARLRRFENAGGAVASGPSRSSAMGSFGRDRVEAALAAARARSVRTV